VAFSPLLFNKFKLEFEPYNRQDS